VRCVERCCRVRRAMICDLLRVSARGKESVVEVGENPPAFEAWAEVSHVAGRKLPRHRCRDFPVKRKLKWQVNDFVLRGRDMVMGIAQQPYCARTSL
jgi:hypothetical protein